MTRPSLTQGRAMAPSTAMVPRPSLEPITFPCRANTLLVMPRKWVRLVLMKLLKLNTNKCDVNKEGRSMYIELLHFLTLVVFKSPISFKLYFKENLSFYNEYLFD